MKLKAFTLYILLLLTLPLSAQQIEVSGSRKAVRTSGDVGAVLLPVAGLTAVLIQKDWEGLKQGAFSALATAGVTYALKYSIRKDRPDHSDRHSFPSMHTIVCRGGIHPKAVRLEMGASGIRAVHLRGLEPDIRQKA